MIDPYRMIFVSLISLLISLLTIFLYIRSKPKTINYFLILFLLSIPPIVSIFREGSYESGDLSTHSMFAMSFYNSLKDGNIIPRWSSEVFFGYGYPLFLFIYPLPYYLSSLLHLLGISFINSFKLILITSYILSGIFMYIWLKDKLTKIAAFTAAIFYLYSPYHLVDLHFRVAIGEVIIFPLIPLTFIFTEKLIKLHKIRWMLLLTLSLSLLILSHQAIALITLPMIAFYIFFVWRTEKNREIKDLIYFYLPFLQAALLCSYYWLPMLIEAKRYTYLIPHPSVEFPEFSQFIYSPWRGGFLFQGPKGELSFVVGYIQWIISFISIYIIIKRKNYKNKKFLIFFIASFFLIFSLMQSFSKIIWENIFILKNFQFSYRLLLLTSFITSVIAGIVANTINKNWFILILCLLAIFPTILNWGNRRTIPSIDDRYLKNELSLLLGSNGGLGPGVPIWFNNDVLKIESPAKKPLEVISGHATIINLERTSTRHEYLITSGSKTTFRENTLYFPGWILKINNKIYNLEYNNVQYPGIIVFHLPKGTYKVQLEFTNTAIRNISILLSLLSFLVIFTYTTFYSLRKVIYKRNK